MVFAAKVCHTLKNLPASFHFVSSFIQILCQRKNTWVIRFWLVAPSTVRQYETFAICFRNDRGWKHFWHVLTPNLEGTEIQTVHSAACLISGFRFYATARWSWWLDRDATKIWEPDFSTWLIHRFWYRPLNSFIEKKWLFPTVSRCIQ